MDDHHDERLPDRSRRGFLKHAAAALAAAGAASVVAGPGAPGAAAQQAAEPTSAPGDCDCSEDSALPVLAAAVVNGEYTALAATNEGPRLYTLAVADDRAVALAKQVSVNAPAGFEAGSLGVARNRLVLAGGMPFVWRRYEVEDQIEPIDVLGVGPAAFFVDGDRTDPISLPDMSAEAFATVGQVAETTHGNIVLMIEHSGGEPESYYAAAVDVFEEVPGGWTVRASARNLGESGPNRLVVDGDAVGVELNTSAGTQVVGAASTASPDALRAQSANILPGDEVVSVVPVAGAKGQSIAIGKRSARLVEEVANVV